MPVGLKNQTVKTIWRIVQPFQHNANMLQTDRQTDGQKW